MRLTTWMAMALAVGLWTGSAQANEEEMLDAATEARIKEGVAFGKAGQYEQARISFMQARVLAPTSAKVLLNLVISEHGSGRYVEALGHLKEYLAHPKRDLEKAKKYQETMYVELWNATGHLNVSADRGEEIAVDGVVKGKAPLEVIDVGPGAHRVTAGGRTEDVSVAAGVTKHVNLASPLVVVPPEERSEQKSKVWKPLTLALGGATVVAGGLALYFNGRSHSHANRADDLRSNRSVSDCSGSNLAASCTDVRGALDDERSAAKASRGMWVGTGVLAVGTVASLVLWLSKPSSSSTGMLVPTVAPRSAGAMYQVSF